MPEVFHDVMKFLSTPSARRATRPAQGGSRQIGISIHALREEGDVTIVLLSTTAKISIHALREEGDHSYDCAEVVLVEFLSTPSARRATLPAVTSCQ